MLQEQGLGPGLKNKFLNKRIFGSLFVGGASSAKQPQASASARLKIVAKLMDAYLAEVARDLQLPLAKFQSLAEAVPASSRVSDDGLYRAIDTYLKVSSSSIGQESDFAPSLSQHCIAFPLWLWQLNVCNLTCFRYTQA
jgi:hypothetical protein